MAARLIATVLGMAGAILMAYNRTVERALFPYAVVLQTIPVLALVPLFSVWFGPTRTARVVTCVLVAIFPMLTSFLFGLKSVDRGHLDLFRLHGASWFTQLRKLQLPAAMPSIFTGLRIGAGLCVVGALVAAGSGFAEPTGSSASPLSLTRAKELCLQSSAMVGMALAQSEVAVLEEEQAKEAAAKDNLRILRDAIERYAIDHNGVPPGDPSNNPSAPCAYLFFRQQMIDSKLYLPKLPENPFNEKATMHVTLNITTCRLVRNI